MNKEWSELNKLIQTQIRSKQSFENGISTLIELRNLLMHSLFSIKNELVTVDFSKICFLNAEGYHSKTIAYSIWHIARIEDIVAHTLIEGDEQIFFLKNYRERINSPIITTGNELVKQEIAEFSQLLNIDELYSYFYDVKESTDKIIKNLSFDHLKRKIPAEHKDNLISMHVVSNSEDAFWLVNYWCSKDIRGLIQMPFSRHWIMHIEACNRIKDRILSKRI